MSRASDTTTGTDCALDAAVIPGVAELERRGAPRPDVLFFVGTGIGMLPGALRSSARLPFSRVPGVPDAWRALVLHWGELAGTPAWLIEDAPGPPEHGTHEPLGEPPWVRGYPCWLAARAGAAVCVHTAAGLALGKAGPPPGSLVLVRDHLNVSGRSPLVGLGGSRLGPLFPDTARLHHAGLRARAIAVAAKIGVRVAEAVAACTSGPALDTPAERAWWSRAGADVAVQNLATPYLACAHAGLALLSIVAVTDGGDGEQDMAAMLQHAQKLAPALEELLNALAPHFRSAAQEIRASAEPGGAP